MFTTSLIRLARRWLRTTMFVGMVPLVILNGLPAGGCICADGHYEPFCHGCASRAAHRVETNASAHRSCCQRACCAGRTAINAKRSCCKSCCQRTSTRTPNVPSVNGPCCTPVAQNPATPVVKVSPATVDHQGLSLFVVATDLPSLAIAAHHGRPVEIDMGPPPDDLVVTLRRLII